MLIQDHVSSNENYLGKVDHTFKNATNRQQEIEQLLFQLKDRSQLLSRYDPILIGKTKLVNKDIFQLFNALGQNARLTDIFKTIEPIIQHLSSWTKEYRIIDRQIEAEISKYLSRSEEYRTEHQSNIIDLVKQLARIKVFHTNSRVPDVYMVSFSPIGLEVKIEDESIKFHPSLVVSSVRVSAKPGYIRSPGKQEVLLFDVKLNDLINRLSGMLKRDLAELNQGQLKFPAGDPFIKQVRAALEGGYQVFCTNYLNRVGLVIYLLNLMTEAVIMSEEAVSFEGILDVFQGKDNLSKVADEHLDGWNQQVEWLDEWYHQSIARNMSEGPDTKEPVEVDRKVYECVKGGRKGSVWNMSIQDYPQMMRKVLYASGVYFDKQMSALKKIRDLLKEYHQSPNETLGKRIVEAFKDIPLHPKVGVPSSEDRVSTPFMNGYRVSHTLSKREYGNTKYGQFRLIHISFSQYGYPDLDHVETDGRMTSVQLPLREEYQRYNQEVEKLFKELSGLAQRTADQHRGLLKQDLTWMQEGDRFFNSVCRAYLDAVGEFVSDRQFTILNVMNALNAWYELGK